MASRLMMALVFLLVACQPQARGNRPQSTATPLSTSQASPMFSVEVSQTGLPDALANTHPIWEVQFSSTPTKPASVTRLYENGNLYSWSNTRRALIDNLPSREPASYAWRLDAQVSAEGVQAVRELIQSEFVELSSESSSTPGPDQGMITWYSHLDGTEHSVTLPIAAYNRLPAVIQRIEHTIQSHVVPGAVPIEQDK